MNQDTGTYDMTDAHPEMRHEGSKSELNALLCADCGCVIDRPFDNGDGKTRCEACAVAYYKKLPGANITIRDPPKISYCDECRHDLGYQAGMHWPPYRKTCGMEIEPTKITKEGRLVKYACKHFWIKSSLRA